MPARMIDAKYVGAYSIRVRFSDGIEGEIDLTDDLWGPVFEPLRDKALFRKFRVDPELHTLVWENGADLAPEYVIKKMKVIV